MVMQEKPCPNLNHRRTNVPVRFCPMCGEMVNSKIPAQVCNEEKHTKSKRIQNIYCMDCGEQLNQGKSIIL